MAGAGVRGHAARLRDAGPVESQRVRRVGSDAHEVPEDVPYVPLSRPGGGYLRVRGHARAVRQLGAERECEKNRRFMLSGCSKSCGVCESKIVGCSRRNPTPGVRAPDGLTRMFERALVDFPQFSPTALSTPKAPVEGGRTSYSSRT